MNEDNNIELPKRIDEEPNPTENIGNVQNENITQQSEDISQNLQDQNTVFPSEEEINRENINIASVQNTSLDTNIFDQNIESNINNESKIPESSFAPIEGLETGLENPTPTQNMNQTDILTIPETQEMETISSSQVEESPINNENIAITPTQPEPNFSDENNQLNKKIVSVDPIKKEKSKGKPIVGFLALLLILAIILAAFYYFVKMEYIIIPDEIKNKIPFFSTTTTTNITENQDDNDEENLSLVNVVGEYIETPPLVCPNVKAKLLLNQDNSFTYNQSSYDEENNNCDITEITGSYLAVDGALELTPTNNTIIINPADYKKQENAIIINIVDGDKTITLTK